MPFYMALLIIKEVIILIYFQNYLNQELNLKIAYSALPIVFSLGPRIVEKQSMKEQLYKPQLYMPV